MLEWRATCPCGEPIGGIALPPWSWWTRMAGARCRSCGSRISPSELERQGTEQMRKQRREVERLRSESAWSPPGGWPPLDR